LAIDEQNVKKQASVLDFPNNRLAGDCRRMGRDCQKTSPLVISPGGIGNLLMDKEN
jgi:hypothetical protein